MVSKDPIRRKEIASMGGKAQHKKYGCLIPIKSRAKGGKNSGIKQRGKNHINHGLPEKLFDKKAKEEGYTVYRHGFPDRAIEKNGKIKLVEIKTKKGKLAKNQRDIYELFRKLGIKVEIWRPGMSLEFE